MTPELRFSNATKRVGAIELGVHARLPSLYRRPRPERFDPELHPGCMAFKTLLREPRILHRLPRHQARRLAEQASSFAAALTRGEIDVFDAAALRARAQHVARATRRWLAFEEIRGDSVATMLASASRRDMTGLGAMLRTLARETPEFNDGSGALAVAVVLELAAEGVRTLAPDQAELLLLASTRHAASFLRGERSMPHVRPGSESAAILDALRVADRIYTERRAMPLDVTPSGHAAVRAELEVGLWRDGTTCADRLAASPTAPMWRNARDGHAFAAVQAFPRILHALVPEEADALAHDASRAAGKVLAHLRETEAGSGLTSTVADTARDVLASCRERPRCALPLPEPHRPAQDDIPRHSASATASLTPA